MSSTFVAVLVGSVLWTALVFLFVGRVTGFDSPAASLLLALICGAVGYSLLQSTSGRGTAWLLVVGPALVGFATAALLMKKTRSIALAVRLQASAFFTATLFAASEPSTTQVWIPWLIVVAAVFVVISVVSWTATRARARF